MMSEEFGSTKTAHLKSACTKAKRPDLPGVLLYILIEQFN